MLLLLTLLFTRLEWNLWTAGLRLRWRHFYIIWFIRWILTKSILLLKIEAIFCFRFASYFYQLVCIISLSSIFFNFYCIDFNVCMIAIRIFVSGCYYFAMITSTLLDFSFIVAICPLFCSIIVLHIATDASNSCLN